MSAAQRLPFIAGLTGAGASFTAVAAIPSLRLYLIRILGVQAPGGIWRFLFIILALLNLKNLPFIWHFRVFRAIIYQLHFQPTRLRPGTLFQPVIMSTRTSLYETDYNIHKSNSTYFTDLDISRSQLVAALFRKGILANDKRQYNMAFGGVTCSFKREIRPFVKYEIWTRLLTWDRKWIYLVSHIVEAGVIKPKEYSLQPWKKGGESKHRENQSEYRERLKKAIYATSISKYVVKNGRITVPPEIALERSDLLPPRSQSTDKENGTANGVVPTAEDSGDLSPFTRDELEWTWEGVEAERLRTLKFAEMFAGLDGLHEEVHTNEYGALGEFPDLLF